MPDNARRKSSRLLLKNSSDTVTIDAVNCNPMDRQSFSVWMKSLNGNSLLTSENDNENVKTKKNEVTKRIIDLTTDKKPKIKMAKLQAVEPVAQLETLTISRCLETHSQVISLDELVVNKNKIKSFQTWLNNVISRPNDKQFKLMLLSGPTGAGKTTLVRQVCRIEKVFLLEWDKLEETNFKDTLVQAGCVSRFKPLDINRSQTQRGCCLLVDDLCDADFKETFRQVQLKTQTVPIPVIGIVTGELLPAMTKHLEDNPSVELKCLTLNSIAPSAVSKILSRYKVDTDNLYRGDLRATMIDTLLRQFHTSNLQDHSITRDHEGSIFHLAGHILHGKGGIENCSDRNQLNRYLQYNYLSFVDLMSALQISEAFSELEVKPWNVRNDELHARFPEWCISSCHPSGTFHSLYGSPFIPPNTPKTDPDEASLVSRLKKLKKVVQEDLT